MQRVDQMRNDLYRKVVLSDGGHEAAMLTMGWLSGVATFTTVEDSALRLAASCDDAEDPSTGGECILVY
jgi:hypothetical protein